MKKEKEKEKEKEKKEITEEGFRAYKQSELRKKEISIFEKFATLYMEMMQEDPLVFCYICFKNIHQLRLFLKEKNLLSEWKKFNEKILNILENTTEEEEVFIKDFYQKIRASEKRFEKIDSLLDGLGN